MRASYTGAIYYERIEALYDSFDTSHERVQFTGNQNTVVSTVTVLLQVFVVGRLLPRLGVTGLLLLEPLVIFFGLLAYEIHPGLFAVICLDGGRKVAHYALMKPAKESIYSQLPGDIKFRAKSLIDATIYRTGSASAAGYYALMYYLDVSRRGRAAICLVLTCVQVYVSYHLGQYADRGTGEPGHATSSSAPSEQQPTAPRKATEATPILPQGEETAPTAKASSATTESEPWQRHWHVAALVLCVLLVLVFCTLALTICFTASSDDRDGSCQGAD